MTITQELPDDDLKLPLCQRLTSGTLCPLRIHETSFLTLGIALHHQCITDVLKGSTDLSRCLPRPLDLGEPHLTLGPD